MSTVLVVDDEPQIARTLRINLTARGYNVVVAHNGGSALRAAVRRATTLTAGAEPVIETEHFTIDLAAKKVNRDGADVHLTPPEWGLLETLARNHGRLISQRQLLHVHRQPLGGQPPQHRPAGQRLAGIDNLGLRQRVSDSRARRRTCASSSTWHGVPNAAAIAVSGTPPMVRSWPNPRLQPGHERTTQ